MTKPTFGHLWMDVIRDTALGPVWVAASASGLVWLEIGGEEAVFAQRLADRFGVPVTKDSDRLKDSSREIREYLQGTRRGFDTLVDWSVMSAFQVKVLREVCAIPYGQVRTYGQIATQVGAPGAARAVGRANATNPVPLVIPCHRVVGANGSLTGYGAGEGIKTKAWLLELEGYALKLS